jgi:hypothetical protein
MTMGAFIYQDGVMENLNDLTIHGETWRVELPYDINDLGQILAAGAGPEGTSMLLLTPEGVPLPAQPTPVPEPGTLAIGLVLAGAGVVAHRRRARMRRAAGGS